MGYRDKTLRLDFSNLGEGCYVLIRNPLLEPDWPDAWDGLSVMERGRRALARRILAWHLFDPDTDEPLPAPPFEDSDAGTAVISRVPTYVIARISQEVNKALSPLRNNGMAEALTPSIPETTAIS